MKDVEEDDTSPVMPSPCGNYQELPVCINPTNFCAITIGRDGVLPTTLRLLGAAIFMALGSSIDGRRSAEKDVSRGFVWGKGAVDNRGQPEAPDDTRLHKLPMSHSFSFPVLNDAELLPCLREMDVPISAAQLAKPTYEVIRPVFEAVVTLLMGVTR